MLGYSNDGSYVYFAANGDLDGSGQAQSGDCAWDGSGRSSGSCSIYLWQADGAGTCVTAGGCISFVAPLDAEGFLQVSDAIDWAGNFNTMKVSRVSADGRTLAFRSQLKLTSYDNQGTPEYYRYDAESGQVTCFTCSPTGAPPVGAGG